MMALERSYVVNMWITLALRPGCRHRMITQFRLSGPLTRDSYATLDAPYPSLPGSCRPSSTRSPYSACRRQAAA